LFDRTEHLLSLPGRIDFFALETSNFFFVVVVEVVVVFIIVSMPDVCCSRNFFGGFVIAQSSIGESKT